MKNILKRFSFIFILLLISITSISFAENETTDTINYDNEVVPISTEGGQPVNTDSTQENTITYQKNYFYAGTDDVNLNNPILGDVFIFTAGNVNINTAISGNAFICAPSVNILENASIQASLFTTADSLNIIGNIGTNVYDASNEFSLKGTIENDLFLASSETTINGYIHGNANISSGNIIISDNAYIENNLNYSSNKEINIPDNVVHGKISYSLNNTKEDTSFDLNDFVSSLISFIILAIVIFVIGKWLKCKFVNNSPDFVKKLPKSLLYGLLGLIVTPIVCILLLIFGVTINLAFILMAIYFILLFIASSIVIIVLSKLISDKLHSKYEKANNTLLSILSIAILSLVYKLLQLIPTFGTIVTFAFVMVGMGILIKNIIPIKEPKNS